MVSGREGVHLGALSTCVMPATKALAVEFAQPSCAATMFSEESSLALNSRCLRPARAPPVTGDSLALHCRPSLKFYADSRNGVKHFVSANNRIHQDPDQCEQCVDRPACNSCIERSQVATPVRNCSRIPQRR